jgi:hypothetical protein
MSRLRSRLLVPALALVALAVLIPVPATALPQGEAVHSAVERREAIPGRFSQLWSLLSVLWSKTGSGLEPDGGPKPTATGSSDNGSGLEPDGRP